MILEDRNFDSLAHRLKYKVYGSAKGMLRIALLWEDIEQALTMFNGTRPLRILDAGGGQGHISLKLAEMGHSIVLCDISQAMLVEAEKNFQAAGLASQLITMHKPLQTLTPEKTGTFDIVMLHAVIEWLADPEQSISAILKLMQPAGFMSLLFYNLNALIHQNAIKGNFRKVMREAYKGDPNSLTPYHPLVPDCVKDWLTQAGFRVTKKTGVRVFYDYMDKQLRKERSFNDVLAIEKKYCRTEPYASLGKYMHYIVRHADNTAMETSPVVPGPV